METNHTKRQPKELAQGAADLLSKYISIATAAAIAGVTTRTIGNWINEEYFLSTRPIAAGSGRRLIDRASFMAFLAGEGVAA